jgi:hypothetical protein
VEQVPAERPNDPAGFGPSFLPTPRGLVKHAYLIVRHLRLPGSPQEPYSPMDVAGCVAALRDVLRFFRRALPGKTPRGTDKKQTARDKWIYNECRKGTTYRKIIAELKRQITSGKEWYLIESVQGVRSAAHRYADAHNLPRPERRQDL